MVAIFFIGALISLSSIFAFFGPAEINYIYEGMTAISMFDYIFIDHNSSIIVLFLLQILLSVIAITVLVFIFVNRNRLKLLSVLGMLVSFVAMIVSFSMKMLIGTDELGFGPAMYGVFQLITICCYLWGLISIYTRKNSRMSLVSERARLERKNRK